MRRAGRLTASGPGRASAPAIGGTLWPPDICTVLVHGPGSARRPGQANREETDLRYWACPTGDGGRLTVVNTYRVRGGVGRQRTCDRCPHSTTTVERVKRPTV